MQHDPLQFPLDVVTVLIRRFGVGGDRRLHTVGFLHRQPLLLLLRPGRAIQLNSSSLSSMATGWDPIERTRSPV